MTTVSMEALMLEEQGLGGEEQAGGVKSSERRSLNEAWEQLKERFWTAATHMQIQGADTGDSSQLSRPAKLILACFLLFIGLLLVVGSQGDGESPYSTTSGWYA